jgi:hypothetical protein
MHKMEKVNRRGFLSVLGKATAGFSILPAATTYSRRWVRTECLWRPNPAWEAAPYEIAFWGTETFVETVTKPPGSVFGSINVLRPGLVPRWERTG